MVTAYRVVLEQHRRGFLWRRLTVYVGAESPEVAARCACLVATDPNVPCSFSFFVYEEPAITIQSAAVTAQMLCYMRGDGGDYACD